LMTSATKRRRLGPNSNALRCNAADSLKPPLKTKSRSTRILEFREDPAVRIGLKGGRRRLGDGSSTGPIHLLQGSG
jgi:hypothetical protein